MATGRKQITFDLDTKALQKYYPGESWNNAYEVIKKHMLKNNFVWLQGSVYVSREPWTSRRISIIFVLYIIKLQEACVKYQIY